MVEITTVNKSFASLKPSEKLTLGWGTPTLSITNERNIYGRLKIELI